MSKIIELSRNTLSEFRETILDLLVAIDTPVSLSIYLQIEYNLAVETVVRPTDYLDPVSLQHDLQSLALIKKNPWFFSHVPAFITRDKAVNKFLECEEKNFHTNNRLKSSQAKRPHANVFSLARQFCAEILGPLCYDDFSFSDGSTATLKGRNANLIRKLDTPPHCTGLAYDRVIRDILTYMPYYAISCGLLKRERTKLELDLAGVRILDGNTFSTVPKDWSTDRPICVEPEGNMLLQLSRGRMIRNRLKAYGLDLLTAQTLHGELARESSLNDSYATIDLSSASDTISVELVREILPTDWFDDLMALRCRITNFPSEYYLVNKDGAQFTHIVNEKFSSMGNGFTFELETLLFYCIGLAIRKLHGKKHHVVKVYGDDIIIEAELSGPLITVLEFCGLSVNTDKSFLSGPFKESCGYDYYNGSNIRPVYLKEVPNDEGFKRTAFANRIYKIARNFGFSCYLDGRFLHAWRRTVAGLPRSHRCFTFDSDESDVSIRGTARPGTLGFIPGHHPCVRDGVMRAPYLSSVFRFRQKPGCSTDQVWCYGRYNVPGSGIPISRLGARSNVCRGRRGSVVCLARVTLLWL